MQKPSLPVFIPSGFRFAATACGIKKSGKLDLSLIVADRPVRGAGVYTTNQIVAAPVLISQSRTPSSEIRAIVTNSGNANACTGDQGTQDALAMTAQVANKIGCDPDGVLVMSTGIIGHALPMEKVTAGIDAATEALSDSESSFLSAADGILTTDVDRKVVSTQIKIDGQTYTIAAMAKGAGMIAPNMATMLGVVLTDAPLSANVAADVLKTAANLSFNRVSVDGHTSTNDTLLLLSSGEGEFLDGDELDQFQYRVNEVCIDLAKKLVADGEGATHVMAINVTGAANEADAELIAKTVAASPLVKTAITGGDPNWGRIVSATGYAGPKIDPTKTSLKICSVTIYRDGSPEPFDAKSLSESMKSNPEVEIELRVGTGPGQAKYWSSDLTCDYVRFNSEYTT
ncbi:Arginine biosynthesis bifunctional protein ArgJ [Rubripirellula obstinata]|uniref:Arginine biosynthesis bifunctional protein ArgJ n=1 Tax=Rubripirellula obstinata TaxID=406547 RepID=A0A5B1CDM4_9BACT|nr:bifunctional glutamate N-acetyltransferase/amino-acid acetyltransferase ArgJ [Rubripirellula obstinata]KAA1257690.1 Arginine biosynthesis bifunctional protein ArgJ [Rubripirellula obstinata]